MAQIASIPIAVVVDGQRKVIPPGAEIPIDAMSAHDTRALLAAGALRDAAADAAQAAEREAGRKAADAEFQAARAAAQAAAASVAPLALPPGPSAAQGRGEPKAPAKSKK